MLHWQRPIAGYRIVEVVGRKGTKWTESIVRTKLFETIEEAQEQLKTIEPKEKGELKIEKVTYIIN